MGSPWMPGQIRQRKSLSSPDSVRIASLCHAGDRPPPNVAGGLPPAFSKLLRSAQLTTGSTRRSSRHDACRASAAPLGPRVTPSV